MAGKRLTRAEVRKLAVCPYCRAPKDEWCRTVYGRDAGIQTSTNHEERYRAAKSAQAPAEESDRG